MTAEATKSSVSAIASSVTLEVSLMFSPSASSVRSVVSRPKITTRPGSTRVSHSNRL